MKGKIVATDTGSTSTKLGYFVDGRKVLETNPLSEEPANFTYVFEPVSGWHFQTCARFCSAGLPLRPLRWQTRNLNLKYQQ